MKGRTNPSLYCYHDITYQSRGGTHTCEKACPYMEEKCVWPWDPLQVELWEKRNQLKITKKYKFSSLLKEMNKAGEDMDYDQVIQEVKTLENEIDTINDALSELGIAFDDLKRAKDHLEVDLSEAEKVLKDICHHVGKDCFATCKGDWSGTSCCTYRIWDALSPSIFKGE